jgi:hypothetical protein
MTDPASKEYQDTTNAIMWVGIALVAFGTVIGPLLCVLWNAL